MSELLNRAKASLEGVTKGPWKWSNYRVPDLLGRAGEPGVYEYDTEVLEAEHGGECGCQSSCTLELNIKKEDREFIAAARQLVPELIAEVERLEGESEHWKALWRGTVEDSTKVIQERDEALRELEQERYSHLETAEVMRRTNKQWGIWWDTHSCDRRPI